MNMKNPASLGTRGRSSEKNDAKIDSHHQANGASLTATLYTLFVPLNYNNGRKIEPELLGWVRKLILDYAGGLTEQHPGLGYWVEDEDDVELERGRRSKYRLYHDRVVPIQVVVPTTPEGLTWFSLLAERLAALLGQKKIFLFSQPVYLLQPLKPYNHIHPEAGVTVSVGAKRARRVRTMKTAIAQLKVTSEG